MRKLSGPETLAAAFAFIQYARKRKDSMGPEWFEHWSAGKDFTGDDRRAIRKLVFGRA